VVDVCKVVVTLSVSFANTVIGESVTGESVTPSALRGALDGVRVGTTLAFVVTSTPKVRWVSEKRLYDGHLGEATGV